MVDRVVHKHPVDVVAVQVEEPGRLRPAVAQCQLRAHARIYRVLVQGVVRAAVQVPGARGLTMSVYPFYLFLALRPRLDSTSSHTLLHSSKG